MSKLKRPILKKEFKPQRYHQTVGKSETCARRPNSDIHSTSHVTKKKITLPPLLTDLFKPSLDSKAYRRTHQIMTASNAFHIH